MQKREDLYPPHRGEGDVTDYEHAAITSISMAASSGSLLISTQERAGQGSGKWFL